jgi:hypothetical protein
VLNPDRQLKKFTMEVSKIMTKTTHWKLGSLIDMAEAGMEYSKLFKLLWESGEMLKEDPTELIEAAALSLFYNNFVKRHGGFFMRRSAKKIIAQIERGMIEAQHSRAMAIRLKEITEEAMQEKGPLTL